MAQRTVRLTVNPDALESTAARQALAQAAEILRSGGTVAFPTETVYGLGAHALDSAAVEKIFTAKQRPAWDPLIVHVTDETQLGLVAGEIPARARPLMEAFWPGPLTLILPRAAGLPQTVTAGRPRVAVRMPAHPVAHALIALAGVPVAAPSANRFGRTSPTRAEWVLQDLDGRIDAVVDSGETTFGLESTVVDACEDPMLLYRPGVVTLEQLRAVVPGVVPFVQAGSATRDAGRPKSDPESLPSPGIGLRHYAPRARLILVQGGEGCNRACAEQSGRGERVGLMWPAGLSGGPPPGDYLVFDWGDWRDMAELAHRLFAGLRELDARGATVIVCPVPEETGVGVAICDRLRKAAQS